MRKSETYRNEIKSYIVRTGMTMTEVVDYLSDEYGWSRSVPESLRQAQARFASLRRGGRAGRRAGVRHCMAEKTKIRPTIIAN